MPGPHELVREIRARISRAAFRLQQGNFEAALDQVEAALELDPEFTPALELRARIRHEMAQALAGLSREPIAPSAPEDSPVRAPATAVATSAEWQSFEHRLCVRAAARRAREARAALQAGQIDTARELVDELHRLDPAHEQLSQLTRELETRAGTSSGVAQRPAMDVAQRVSPADRAPISAGSSSPGSTPRRGWRAATVLASLAATVVFTGGPGWLGRGDGVDEVDAQARVVRVSVVAAPESPRPPDRPERDAAPPAQVSVAPAPPAGTTAARNQAPLPSDPVISGDAVPAGPAVAPIVSRPGSEPVVPPEVALDAGTAAFVPPRPEELVRETLSRYEAAYNRLDAEAARAIWPSVDYRALSRAFEGLEAQTVVLERCFVELADDRARAACTGRASYVPRVGSRTELNRAGRWTFALRRTGEEWWIERVEAR